MNRIELALLEFAEAGGDMLKFMVLFVLALIALWFAIAYGSIALVFFVWPFWGWKILLVLGGFFTVLGIGIAWYARSILRRSTLSLCATLTELRKDSDAIL